MNDQTEWKSFNTTHWSFVYEAHENEDALGKICKDYWAPIYTYIRRQNNNSVEAQDLTQSFFLHLIESQALKKAQHEKGKFRTFLLASVKNFMLNEIKSNKALKRGGGKKLFSISDLNTEEWFHNSIENSRASLEQHFDQAWAYSILNKIINTLEKEYSESHKKEFFNIFKPVLSGGLPNKPYTEIAELLGLSLSSIKVNVHRLKSRYKKLLYETIADTVDDNDSVEDEIKYLISCL